MVQQKEKVSLMFSRTLGEKANANSGLTEMQARFVIVHEGREEEAHSIMQSLDALRMAQSSALVQFAGDPTGLSQQFGAAHGRQDTHLRNGVVLIGRDAIESRIGMLEKQKPAGYEATIEAFNQGLQLLDRYQDAMTPATGMTAKVTAQVR